MSRGVVGLRAQFGGLFGGGGAEKPSAQKLKSELMAACKQSERGVKGGREEVEAIIDKLGALSPTKTPTMRCVSTKACPFQDLFRFYSWNNPTFCLPCLILVQIVHSPLPEFSFVVLFE